MNSEKIQNKPTHDSTLQVTERLEALTTLIGRLGALHGELADTLGDKFEALRHGALDKLGPLNDRAVSLATNITEQDGLRKQLMQDIGRRFGMSTKIARELPARRLAERVSEPHRTRLNEATSRLKETIDRVRQINDQTGRVTGDVVDHLQQVFRAVTSPYEPGDEYTGTGAGTTTGQGPKSAISKKKESKASTGVFFEAIG